MSARGDEGGGRGLAVLAGKTAVAPRRFAIAGVAFHDLFVTKRLCYEVLNRNGRRPSPRRLAKAVRCDV